MKIYFHNNINFPIFVYKTKDRSSHNDISRNFGVNINPAHAINTGPLASITLVIQYKLSIARNMSNFVTYTNLVVQVISW